MTEPLTPPDCDLRDFAFMPLDATRLLDSDLFALASGDEFKAAIALWCKAWMQIPSASLPDDDRVLAHLSGAGPRWKKVRAMALRGFVKCSDGRLYHCVVAEKANEAWAKKLSYRERSKKGNNKRWASQKDGGDDPNAIPKGVLEGVLEPPKGQGQGQGQKEEALAKAKDAEASSDKAFWDSGKGYLKPHIKGDPGSLIGKWCRDFGGQKPVAAAITAAQLERAVDPVAYIERVLRKVKQGASHDDLVC